MKSEFNTISLKSRNSSDRHKIEVITTCICFLIFSDQFFKSISISKYYPFAFPSFSSSKSQHFVFLFLPKLSSSLPPSTFFISSSLHFLFLFLPTLCFSLPPSYFFFSSSLFMFPFHLADHLAFSVIWEMDDDANILDVRFCKSAIHSVASLTYDEVR